MDLCGDLECPRIALPGDLEWWRDLDFGYFSDALPFGSRDGYFSGDLDLCGDLECPRIALPGDLEWWRDLDFGYFSDALSFGSGDGYFSGDLTGDGYFSGVLDLCGDLECPWIALPGDLEWWRDLDFGYFSDALSFGSGDGYFSGDLTGDGYFSGVLDLWGDLECPWIALPGDLEWWRDLDFGYFSDALSFGSGDGYFSGDLTGDGYFSGVLDLCGDLECPWIALPGDLEWWRDLDLGYFSDEMVFRFGEVVVAYFRRLCML